MNRLLIVVQVAVGIVLNHYHVTGIHEAWQLFPRFLRHTGPCGVLKGGHAVEQFAYTGRRQYLQLVVQHPILVDTYCVKRRLTGSENLQRRHIGGVLNCDFVTIHTPLTEETRYIIGMEQFRPMKPTVYFINCARGEVVRENELIEALHNGIIRGAGIDVFDPEPPTRNNPLFAMDNVVLTPHSSALTTQGSRKMAVQSVEQLLKVLQGDGPEHLVNKEIRA